MARKIRYYDITERTCECGCGLQVKELKDMESVKCKIKEFHERKPL